MFAAIAVTAGSTIARVSVLAAGALVPFWMVVQVRIIGYVPRMQPSTAKGGLLILLLPRLLPTAVTASEKKS